MLVYVPDNLDNKYVKNDCVLKNIILSTLSHKKCVKHVISEIFASLSTAKRFKFISGFGDFSNCVGTGLFKIIRDTLLGRVSIRGNA